MSDTLSELKLDAAAWLRAARSTEWSTPVLAHRSDNLGQYRVWLAALCLACELWLKYLYSAYAQQQYPTGHKLAELYDTLPEAAKNRLDAQFNEETYSKLWKPIRLDATPMDSSTTAVSGPTMDARRFRVFFELLDRARPDFDYTIDRYQFEKYSSADWFIHVSREAV